MHVEQATTILYIHWESQW